MDSQNYQLLTLTFKDGNTELQNYQHIGKFARHRPDQRVYVSRLHNNLGPLVPNIQLVSIQIDNMCKWLFKSEKNTSVTEKCIVQLQLSI